MLRPFVLEQICSNGFVVFGNKGLHQFSGLNRIIKDTTYDIAAMFAYDLDPRYGNLYYDVYYGPDATVSSTIKGRLATISQLIFDRRPREHSYQPDFSAVWALVVTYESVTAWASDEVRTEK